MLYYYYYYYYTDVTSGFASESTSKLDSLDSRIRIRIRQIEYGLRHQRFGRKRVRSQKAIARTSDIGVFLKFGGAEFHSQNLSK